MRNTSRVADQWPLPLDVSHRNNSATTARIPLASRTGPWTTTALERSENDMDTRSSARPLKLAQPANEHGQRAQERERDDPLDRTGQRVAATRAATREMLTQAIGQHSYGALRCYLTTLTYHGDPRFRLGHSDIAECIEKITKRLKYAGADFYYTWCLEVTERGIAHYHVLWWVRDGVVIPDPTRIPKGCRTKPWPHGFADHKLVRPRPGESVAVAWMAVTDEYISKCDKAELLPRGRRICGYGSTLKLAKAACAHKAKPKWLQQVTQPGEPLRVAKGGGKRSLITGQVHKSPNVLVREWVDDKWTYIGFVSKETGEVFGRARNTRSLNRPPTYEQYRVMHAARRG